MVPIPPEVESAARRIAGSELFRGDWYAATHPDVAASGLDPALHYALVGGRLGRDPGPAFDARAYSQAEGDLIGQGVNPLIHWHDRGLDGAPPSAPSNIRLVQRLTWHLWGGLPEEAEAALLALAERADVEPRSRAEALVRVADRLAFDGHDDRAARVLERVETAMPSRGRGKDVLIRRAALALRSGRPTEARDLLARVPPPRGGGRADPDAALLLSAAEPDDASRLAALNAVLAGAGIETLRLADPAAPLGLGSIVAEPAPRALPFVGLVSVVVPAFRAASVIGAALRSLLAQSYPDLEILVVDDGSDDGTFDVVSAMAAEDGRLRPMRAPERGGAYAARNIGLAAARGAFVTTHDADDWSHPRKIEAQLRAFLRDPALVANAASWARVRSDLRPTTGWRLSGEVLHLSYSSIMLRREAAERLGPWDEVRAGADAEYLWRIERVFGARSFSHVAPEAPLAFALDEEGSLTRAKAVHVATNYHGPRLLYRQACRHHLAGPDPLDPDARARKMRRVPAEMRGLPPDATPVDLCLVGDLFSRRVVEAMRRRLEDPALADARVGIAHEPVLSSWSRRFPDELWSFLDGERVRFVLDAPREAAWVVRIGGEGHEGGGGGTAADRLGDGKAAARGGGGSR